MWLAVGQEGAVTFKECCFEAFTGASTASGARVRTVRATRGVGVLVVGTKYAWGVGSGGSRVARGTGTRGTGTRGVDTGGTGARGSGRVKIMVTVTVTDTFTVTGAGKPGVRVRSTRWI